MQPALSDRSDPPPGGLDHARRDASLALAPIRLATRFLAEMQTSILCAGIAVFGGNLDRFAIFTLIMRQSVAPPGDPRAVGISINGLAQSLSYPFESMRRHVNALLAAGLCVRGPGGIAAAPDALQQPALADVILLSHDCFVRLVEDLKRFDVPMPEHRDVPYDFMTGINAAIDLMLAVADSNAQAHADWAELVLFSAILCANTKLYIHDPVLGRRYADQTAIPPRELLLPISMRRVALALSMPVSTAQRWASHLQRDGRVVRTRGGLLVSEEWLNRPQNVAISTQSYHNIGRILHRVASQGFPFEEPVRAYARGRPPSVAFA
ncbi:hypothetical protein QH494_11905 [Sphingomonas sp. AR_OL41]|uniref:hypothetical protein n=1 Tax=Sphingomonas sp. AR_OL41 TaxID=3042729 RepID=UPI0024802AF0|nr:hypothetical protein [Sphingomonas sp. AR_OL41]MDH7972891.1 hypothetical protein [Sphingomonas sp. AR_OL41]